MDLVAEKFPKTVSSAVDKLAEQLSTKDRVKIANMSQNALSQFHKSIETYILTEFRLPGNAPLLQSCARFAQQNPIDHHEASYIIVHALQLKLKETTFIRVLK